VMRCGGTLVILNIHRQVNVETYSERRGRADVWRF
jgi:hypothetical protein